MAFLSVFALGIAILATILYFYSRWNEERSRVAFAARNVKYVPQPNAFIQTMRKQRLEEPKHDMIQKHGKVFGFNFLTKYTICVAEPEIAQIVLSKEFTNFANRRALESDDIFFKNLAAAKDEQWKRLRSVVTPTFSVNKLRRIKPLIDDTVRTLSKNFDNYLARSSLVNVKQIYGAYTMDTVVQVGFGTKVDSLVDQSNPVINKAKQMFSTDISLKNIFAVTMILMAPKLANALKIRFNGDITNFFVGFSSEIIKRKREELAKRGHVIGKANNLLELMLEAEIEQEKLKDGQMNGIKMENVVFENGTEGESDFAFKTSKFMTTDEIISQSVLFMVAGYDTTATTITMASYLLSVNPEAQVKLYRDIQSVIAKLAEEAGPDGPKDPVELVTIESLSRFEYLNAVINETLRIYSPATFTERVAGKDMTLETEDGRVRFDVKKGDVVHFPIYSFHRDPDQFPEPEVFKPERFMGEPKFHKYSYMPFGSGPRNCVAKLLALLEAKLALLHTIRQYKLSVAPETKIPPEFYYQSQIIVPKNIILKVEKR